ncbi:MAG: ribonuclease HII [Oscillospiraceae bacterium]|nr:ribonuclease HII [Oscillospiraceae bacterium]
MPEFLPFESTARGEGFQTVCGIDEAGRGPLAGPVFAAAVILPPGLVIDGLDDSKKLTEKKREALFDIIKSSAVCWSVAYANEKEIDEINILQATFLAMKRAAGGLLPLPSLALVDGNMCPALEVPARAVVKGDSVCQSIAAASVLAKVSRDRFMYALDEEYPQYQFKKHKGYGTKLHYEMLAEHGISPVHRRTFLKKILYK